MGIELHMPIEVQLLIKQNNLQIWPFLSIDLWSLQEFSGFRHRYATQNLYFNDY